MRGGGAPLPAGQRGFFERRLGGDLSSVRLHADARAATISKEISARAFAIGNDIGFAEGAYRPETDEGRRLLAHELVHTRQQDGTGDAARVLRRTPDGDDASATEDQAAEAAVAEDAANAAEAAEPAPPPRPEVEELDYAFVFTGGAYGHAAEAFIGRYYPEYRLIRAGSIEEMFDRLYTDMKADHHGRTPHLRELIIVTHANAAGGMKIPLTRGDGKSKRFFNLWDVDDLQEEFQQGLHQRFRQRRREVVATLIDDDTRVVVRGCEFGKSDEAMDVLRSMFGGQPKVWAPRAYQGYESVPIGAGSHLKTPEEAFDFLVRQDFLPAEMAPSPDEDKRAYIARVFGAKGHIPTEFFVVGKEDHDKLAGMIGAGKGMSEEAEAFKQRDPATIPSRGEFWNLSEPGAMGSDSELDPLTLREIAVRARDLNRPYKPQNACMLQRLEKAWERKVHALPYFLDYVMENSNDPLGGMPGDSMSFMRFLEKKFRDAPDRNPLGGLSPESYFGDSNLLAGDAYKYPCKTPHEDTFETRMLDYELPSASARADAGTYDAELATEPPVADTLDAPRKSPDAQADAAKQEQEALERYRKSQNFDKSEAPPPPPPPIDLRALSDSELGAQYEIALQTGNDRLLAEVENEFLRRIEDPEHPGFGLAIPRGLEPGIPANAGVSPEVALELLKNAAEGKFPWRPELGKVGGVAWFITEGTPYVGADRGGSMTIPVELVHTDRAIVFRDADLMKIYEQKIAELTPKIEAELRASAGLKEGTPLTGKMRKNLARLLERAAERRMWETVGETVRASQHGVGEVVLENSRFSRSGNGRFAVVAKASDIRVKGGIPELMSLLEKAGAKPDPVVTAAAEEMATKMKWAGRVRGGFRFAGRVLIVVAIANDAYRIYTATDRTRAVVSTAGGWAGAVAAGSAFAAWYTPADTAGPWAWVGHGLGTLIAGGIGYFVGSEATEMVYELIVDDGQEIQK